MFFNLQYMGRERLEEKWIYFNFKNVSAKRTNLCPEEFDVKLSSWTWHFIVQSMILLIVQDLTQKQCLHHIEMKVYWAHAR